MRLPRRVLSPAFIEAWREYEYRNRKAAAMYAIRTASRAKYDGGRPKPRDCPRCGAKTRARTEHCAACVREERGES
jgi:hypothetical protein